MDLACSLGTQQYVLHSCSLYLGLKRAGAILVLLDLTYRGPAGKMWEGR